MSSCALTPQAFWGWDKLYHVKHGVGAVANMSSIDPLHFPPWEGRQLHDRHHALHAPTACLTLAGEACSVWEASCISFATLEKPSPGFVGLLVAAPGSCEWAQHPVLPPTQICMGTCLLPVHFGIRPNLQAGFPMPICTRPLTGDSTGHPTEH